MEVLTIQFHKIPKLNGTFIYKLTSFILVETQGWSKGY